MSLALPLRAADRPSRRSRPPLARRPAGSRGGLPGPPREPLRTTGRDKTALRPPRAPPYRSPLTAEATAATQPGAGKLRPARPSRVSPPPGRPRPAPVLFALATAAEGLSGGWGGDTGGAGGRAGARTGAARGQRSWRRGTAARAVYLAAPVIARRPGCRGSASRAAVSVAVGPARRRPGGHDRLYSAVLLFSLSAGPPPPPPPGPWGNPAAITICVCSKTTKNPGALGSALVQCLLPGPLPAILAQRAPRGECRGRPARLGTDSVSAALRAAAGPTQSSSGTFPLCQQRTEK